jgi:hypothetical protein
MNPFMKLLSLCFIAAATSASGQVVLIGWNTFNGDTANETPSETADPNITGTLSGGNLENTTVNIASTTYGTAYSFTPSATDLGISANSFNNGNRRIDFTITNNTGADISLDSIHFDAQLQFDSDSGGATLDLVHLSGNPVGSGASDLLDGFAFRNLFNPGGTRDPASVLAGGDFSALYQYNVSLSPMADVALANGETAAFRIQVNNVDATNGVGVKIDNIAYSGTIVPEPSTFAILAGFGALGLVMYRRRRTAA